MIRIRAKLLHLISLRIDHDSPKEVILIKAVASITANYIYHMLSVSKCGYDNKYGEEARFYHNTNDLLTLEALKDHITVNGGEHCGRLYWICVAVPASLDEEVEMIEYFTAMHNLFSKNNFTYNFNKYHEVYKKVSHKFGIHHDIVAFEQFYLSYSKYKSEISKIFEIYLSNYKTYLNVFWKGTYLAISDACDKMNSIFENNNFQQLWEENLNIKYKFEHFYVILCNSIENGPQAIDISYDKDVFFLSNNCFDDISFISHEFGIFLLKDILSDTIAFKDMTFYKQVESLAEFFNRMICGESMQCDWHDHYISLYGDIYTKNPSISVKELFLSIIESTR